MIRRRRRWSTLAPLLLALGAGTHAAASAPPSTAGAIELEEPEPRLVIADGTSGAVEVLDLVSGEPVTTLDAAGVSSLATDGRYVFAVATDDDAVTVLDGGSWVVAHGDHVHSFATEPSVVGTYEGPTPIHTVANDDQVVVFFDGDGAAAFATDDLSDSGAQPAVTIEAAGPHHGVVVALQGHYVVSVPGVSAEDLPTGVEVRHGATEVEADFSQDCPELHGEAAFDDGVLFACDDGALWVTGGEGAWSTAKIAWPEATSGEARAWSFAHTHGVPVVAGVAGEGLVVVDVEAGTASRLDAPGDVLALAVADDGASLLAVTRDGVAHLVDVASGEVTATAPVVTEVAADVESYQPASPKIVVDGSRAYIGDPAAGRVVEVATDGELRVARTFDVDVAPASLVVVGGAG